MKLVEFVPPVPHPLWRLCRQMGIDEVIVKVNPALTGLADPWKFETLDAIVSRLAASGLRVVGLEGDPFDMAPIKQFGEKGGTPAEVAARETALAHYRELLASMGRLGIRLLCYNFMVGTGWARTGMAEGRGGARATCFRLADVPAAERAAPLKLDADQVWANYETFIRAVTPAAEAAGVRLGLHPDDPCLDSLGGYARIFGSVAAYDRAWALAPSPANAVTFCQANFTLMGADLAETARHFASRIAFIHVRDVEGNKTDFRELFHDQGATDQFALMRVYRSLGLDVPVRGDHVPEMEGDALVSGDCVGGYSTLGRLFANGYLKALLRGVFESGGEWDVAGIESIARGVCVRDGKLLVCRAKGAKTCYLPGGHIEFGETGRVALVREMEEETGRVATVNRFLGSVENSFLQHGQPHAEINLVYEMSLDSFDVSSREDWITFEWVPLADLPAAGLLPTAFHRLAAWPQTAFAP